MLLAAGVVAWRIADAGIGPMTPDQVDFGQADAVPAARQVRRTAKPQRVTRESAWESGSNRCRLALFVECSVLSHFQDRKGSAEDAQNDGRTAQSVDQRGFARTQGVLKSEDARPKNCEGDEADRNGGAAKSKCDRHRPRPSALTIVL